ncbi:MAG TPA: ribosome silencing factor [Lacisediminihabitans sp.]|uniref:ribosome silencing factor n=1 Tax=Lacisediminihabitans sp. TaxID=2787631 RepID=UPI002ED7ACCA
MATEAALGKLATDPVVIDVSERLHLAEAFLITSAPSERQVRAIAENVMDEMSRQFGILPDRIEGRSDARWVLVDYGDLTVHVLVDEDREYYALEKLWGDCPVIPLEHLGVVGHELGDVAV